MSKQVEFINDTLFVSTREPYHKARRVIIQRKGETSKVYYPFNYSRLTDPEDFKDWTICGYKVRDLITLAESLKNKNFDEFDLRDYSATYISGYTRGAEDQERAFIEATNQMLNSLKEVNNAQLMDKINRLSL